MTVISEGPLCLKIHLNKAEVKRYFTSYDKINYGNPEVRKTIDFLFAIASGNFDFEYSGNLTTELYPTGSGGCIFRFTSEPDIIGNGSVAVRAKAIPAKMSTYTFIFNCTDDLINGIEAVYKNRYARQYLSSAYRSKNKYYLIVRMPLTDAKSAIILNEFSNLSIKADGIEKIIDEHYDCIAKGNAIEIIGKAFC